ncbi:MAG: DUF4132 domain-containing protein [Opitutaceae bacterium]
MPEETTETLLQSMLEHGDKDEINFAKTLLEYAETRDHALVQKIPDDPGWWTYRVGPQSIQDLHETSLHSAVAELAALKIKVGLKAESTYLQRFCEAAVNSEKGSKRLISAAESVELKSETLCAYLILNCDLRFNFGWNPITTEFPFSNQDSPKGFDKETPKDIEEFSTMERFIWQLSDESLISILKPENQTGGSRLGVDLILGKTIQGALAIFRPEVIQTLITKKHESHCKRSTLAWPYILRANRSFDQECITDIKSIPADIRAQTLITLEFLRDGQYSDLAREAAMLQSNRLDHWSLVFLADHFPRDMIEIVVGAIAEGERLQYNLNRTTQVRILQSAAANWNSGGKAVFDALAQTSVDGYRADFHQTAIEVVLKGPTDASVVEQHEWLKALLEFFAKEKSIPMEHTASLWQTVVEINPNIMQVELWELISGKSKILRDIAVMGLAKALTQKDVPAAIELLSAKRMDARLGATGLLQALGGDDAIKALQSALETEKSDKVRTAMHSALESLGVASAEPDDEAPALTYTELLSEIEKQAKRIKLPKGNWLQLDQLPPLQTTDGSTLSELALTFLIQKQSKQKTISVAGDVLPLIQQLDRAQSTPFSLALFNQWMASGQVAADRWVLTLTGLLSDTSAIPVLIKTIPTWAENSRHKMAEYAAQAIALIPGDEALTVLDSLATRYRSKFKNIGTACRAALNAAAAERGVTVDELADLIVPDFDFNEEAQRTITWDNGSVIAELDIDFKLTWVDPETDKARKAPPSNLPDDTKKSITVLKKLIREAVKGQTARLELNLVRQRRWPITRWQALFEQHPLLRGYGSRLVWGVYTADGSLTETFRRYPNGLLANAAGSLIELEDGPEQIGMVHPLDLSSETLAAWQEHLGRFKIKPPFPQLDRQVITLKDLHGNRKEIKVTDNKEVGYGTFRSRCEKRGWSRGSVVDAGGISSYYKDFPGAGIEVYLFLEECWVGMDPMDTVTLGSAFFAKENSITRGSYTYDEPSNGDDPRVVAFGKVPPVVYSETMSDLYTIIGETPTEDA